MGPSLALVYLDRRAQTAPVLSAELLFSPLLMGPRPPMPTGALRTSHSMFSSLLLSCSISVSLLGCLPPLDFHRLALYSPPDTVAMAPLHL